MNEQESSDHHGSDDDSSSQRHPPISVIPLKLPASKSSKIQLKRTSTPFKLFRRRSTAENSVNSGLSSMTSRSYLFDAGDSEESSSDETPSTNSEASSASEFCSNSERPWHERLPFKSSMKVKTQEESLARVYSSATSTTVGFLFSEPSTCSFSSWIFSMVSSSSSEDPCTENEPRRQGQKVAFSDVKINYHRTIIGTRVHHSLAIFKDERGEGGDTIGPTLALGEWVCSESMSVEEMQQVQLSTKAERDKTLRLSIDERRRILKVAGISKRDISHCEHTIAKEKRALSKEKHQKEGGSRSKKLKSIPFFKQQSRELSRLRDRIRL